MSLQELATAQLAQREESSVGINIAVCQTAFTKNSRKNAKLYVKVKAWKTCQKEAYMYVFI